VHDASDVPVRRLILIPALITLAVTLLRLIGELQHWSPTLFSRQAGGAGALVGIVWLVFAFGFWFALKLRALGYAPPGAGRVMGWGALGFAAAAALMFVAGALGAPFVLQLTVGAVASVVAVAVAWRGWPALARVLLAYGLAARIPVAVVMLLAMLGDWGTHYDAPAPGMPPMGTLTKWLVIGLLPQLTLWIAFTVTVGMIFGGLALAVTRRRGSAAPVPGTLGRAS
jgi:hypothetical protein